MLAGNVAPWALVFSKSLRRRIARNMGMWSLPVECREELRQYESALKMTGLITGLFLNLVTLAVFASSLIQ